MAESRCSDSKRTGDQGAVHLCAEEREPPNQSLKGWYPASMCADGRSMCADDPVSLCADDLFAMCADDPLSMCADDQLTQRSGLAVGKPPPAVRPDWTDLGCNSVKDETSNIVKRFALIRPLSPGFSGSAPKLNRDLHRCPEVNTVSIFFRFALNGQPVWFRFHIRRCSKLTLLSYPGFWEVVDGISSCKSQQESLM